ncbi:MAG TPA: hypothetical protein VLL49_11400 [Anaerolineales bacterium]|nr:hypothetical protein [Anaerolineales bacterium]
MLRKILMRIVSPENLLALALAIMLVLIVMFAVDTAPAWIYQGF